MVDLSTDICIVGARRTPQGRFLGSLKKLSAVRLAVAASKAALDNIEPQQIDRVIVGNVLSAGLGMNMARQIGIGLGIPQDRPALTVNMMCASGMQAVILAAQSILVGESRVVLCGGTESMSSAPYLLDRARTGLRLGDSVLIDSVLRDGLVDTFSDEHMGLSADRLAADYQIDRAAQDAFALASQQKAAKAQKDGRFDAELVALPELGHDEHPRPDSSLDQLATLRPAFTSNGTVTPGNASGINDGAAMLVLCDAETASVNGWKPLARLQAYATVGCDPQRMGLGPVHATRRLCERHNLALDDFDAIEINEAFAAQALACLKEFQLDGERVNINGGAIALGHPIGASGARLLVHLAHQIAQGQATQTLATLCVGGGMGSAAVLSNG